MPGRSPLDRVASRHGSSNHLSQQSAQSTGSAAQMSFNSSQSDDGGGYFNSDDEVSCDSDDIRAAIAFIGAIVNKDYQECNIHRRRRRQPQFKAPEEDRRVDRSHHLSIKEDDHKSPPEDDEQNNIKPHHGTNLDSNPARSRILKVSQSLDASDRSLQLPSMVPTKPTYISRVMTVGGAGKSSGLGVSGKAKAGNGTGLDAGIDTGIGAGLKTAGEVEDGIVPTTVSAFNMKRQRSASPGSKFGALSSLVSTARALMSFSGRSPSQSQKSNDITQSAPSSPARQRPLPRPTNINNPNHNVVAQSAPSSPRQHPPVAAVAAVVVSPPTVAPTSRQLARPFSRNPSRQNSCQNSPLVSRQNSRSSSPAVVRVNAAGMATSVPALTLPQLPLTYYLPPVREQEEKDSSSSLFSDSDVSSMSSASYFSGARSSALTVPGSMAASAHPPVPAPSPTSAPAVALDTAQPPVSAPVTHQEGHDEASPPASVPAALAVAGRAPTLRDLLQIGFVLSPRDTPRDNNGENIDNSVGDNDDDNVANNIECAAAALATLAATSTRMAPSPPQQPPSQSRPLEQHPRHPRHPVVVQEDASPWRQLAMDLQIGKSASKVSEY